MNEIMYDQSSVMIAVLLFVALIAATELTFHLGRRSINDTTEAKKSQITAIQGSILGVLALLLGFTFSLSLQRFDSRSEAVVSEANAIGTAVLRADLLPPAYRSDARQKLKGYLDLRVQAGDISLDHQDERQTIVLQSNEVLDEIWRLAAEAAGVEPNPVTTGLFIQAVNEVIDSYGSRDAELNRHVPETVLFLLLVTLVMTASLVGYGSGVSGHRASLSTHVLYLLIVLMVFLIIDLDRPRRGLIEVSQQSMLDLQTSISESISR